MKKFSLFILILLLFASLFTFPVLAQERKTILLPKNETVNKDYFAAGSNVILSGTVNGDAYLAGGNVLVDGDINGDLLVAGGNVTIHGKVAHNIRALGGTINFYAPVGGNISVAAGQVTLADGTTVSGSLAGAAGSIDILGPVKKEINVAAGQINIASQVGGNINAAVDQLTLTSNASVNGNVTYWSDQKAQIENGATISGKLVQKYYPVKKPEETTKDLRGIFAGLISFFKIAQLISLFVVGLLILKLMPAYFKRTVEVTLQKPWKNILVGMIALIVTPVIGFLLLLTISGIPFSFILLISYVIILYLSTIFISYIVGQKVLTYLKINFPDTLILLIGIVLFAILSAIPILGWIIGIFAFFLGVGGILVEEKGFYSLLHQKKLI